MNAIEMALDAADEASGDTTKTELKVCLTTGLQLVGKIKRLPEDHFALTYKAGTGTDGGASRTAFFSAKHVVCAEVLIGPHSRA